MGKEPIRFELDISGAQSDAVASLGATDLGQALGAVAQVALREWLEWLVADDRPASLTESSKRRVKALIEAGVLEGPPTAPVLAQRLRLTLGQARYIVSALALENPATSAAARMGLAARIREALDKIGYPEPDKLDEAATARLATSPASASFDAPRFEGDLAAAVHEDLISEQFRASGRVAIADFEPPKIRRRTDSFVTIELRPHVALAILRRLRQGAK